ncbi:MAG: hypothetical protein ABIL02_00380 [candidate division WOR-3 bacterium]
MREEEGQALTETLVIVMILVGLFASLLFFGRLGDKIEQANMGARVLAFNTGDPAFAWPVEPESAKSEISLPILPSVEPPIFEIPFVKDALNKLTGTRSGEISLWHKGKIGGWGYSPFHLRMKISYETFEDPWRNWEGDAKKIYRGSIWLPNPGIYNTIVIGNIDLRKLKELIEEINNILNQIYEALEKLFGGG